MSDSTSAVTYVLWYYTPSLPAGVAAAVLFAVVAAAHLIRLMQKKMWFCIPLLIGAIFEVLGYGCRVWAHFNTAKTMPYAIQSLLLLLAPILFAASIYMFLGRIIKASHGEMCSMIPAQKLTKIFVCSDVLCFFVQGGGGGLMSGAKTLSRMELGEHVILGGLALQIVIFLFFVVVAAVWHYRMKQLPAKSSNFHWQKHLGSLYIVSVLIAGRNIVRCLEFGMGSNGYLLTHEWTTYVFDALPMITVLILTWFWYSSDVNAQSARTCYDEEGSISVSAKQ